MPYFKKRLVSALILLLCICLMIFLPSGKTQRPAEIARVELIKNSDALLFGITELEELARGFVKGDIKVEELRAAFSAVRLEYKKSEFLLEYFYPKYVKGKINGAPLYHLNPYTPKAVIHAPKGLQRLDEVIYTDDVYEAQEELVKLAHALKLDFNNLHKNIVNHPLLDREIFEAARLEVIRIFTLGVTGFDTPGSLNALEEASSSLQQLQVSLSPYLDQLERSHSSIGTDLNQHFSKGMQSLSDGSSFENFDRLQFLKEVVNPLYSGILELQLAIGLETPDEVSGLKKSINYSSDNIFNEDFLNPYFYSKLAAETDNEKLSALGSKLFYEPRLSKDAKFSCSSCHNPQKGFTDGVDRHTAFDGQSKLQRNSPTLLNAMYSTRFFTDMRAFRFDDQIEHVVVSHKEFNTSYENMFAFLEGDEEYRQLFEQTFGTDYGSAINRNNFSLALASYLISLKSFNSPFDHYVRGESEEIAPEVRRGFNLFMGKAACGTCHFAPTFSGLVPPIYNESESEVLGVLKDPNAQTPELDEDRGRVHNGIPMEQVWIYDHSFKTSTVRNIELTAPYFHNGAYNSLEEVLEFYNNGGGIGAGLELENQTLPPDSLDLSEAEQADIIAFMKALTDTTYTFTPAY